MASPKLSVARMQTSEALSTKLESLDTAGLARAVEAAADVTLIVDRDGIIEDASFGEPSLREGGEVWRGRRWLDTVTVESRPKVEQMMRAAPDDGAPRWRQVNHPQFGGTDLPVRYMAIPIGDDGRIVAIGRDLSAISAVQRDLVAAQQAVEREYARIRSAELRYRQLFDLSSEPMLIVDAASLRTLEANPAAIALIGREQRRIVGRPFASLFDAGSSDAFQSAIFTARTSGQVDAVPMRFGSVSGAEAGANVRLAASLFRQGTQAHLIVRLAAADAAPAAGETRLSRIIEALPDGFVVADFEQRILSANRAFLDLAQLATPELAEGERLDRWLGRAGVDISVLLANAREHGTVQRFAMRIIGEFGAEQDVSVSAVAVLGATPPCIGITLRQVPARNPTEVAANGLPRSAEQLTELVGRVSLKELVQETTDLIERMCIEAALKLTGDNRASAAELLGLSRQSLYVKLRRFGIGGAEIDTAV